MGVEIIVAKNTWSNLMHEARARERISMRNPGKAWEISGKYGKSRETPKNPGKSRDIFLENLYLNRGMTALCLSTEKSISHWLIGFVFVFKRMGVAPLFR